MRQTRLDDRRVELAAKDEDRGDEVQEHQRDDDGGEPRIHRNVVTGKARQILSEHDAREQRRQHGKDDTRQNLQEAAASGWQPRMQDEQR